MGCCLRFRLLLSFPSFFGVCLFGLCAFCLPLTNLAVGKSIATICVYIFSQIFLFFCLLLFLLVLTAFFYFVAGCIFAIFPAHLPRHQLRRRRRRRRRNRLRMSFDQASFDFSSLRLSLLPFGKLKCASRVPQSKNSFRGQAWPRATWGNSDSDSDCNCNCISSNLAMHWKKEKQFKAVFETVFLGFFFRLLISFVAADAAAAAWWHNSRASRRSTPPRHHTPRPTTRTFSTPLEQAACKCCCCCCYCC